MKKFAKTVDKRGNIVYNKNTNQYLIKSGGGTGPVKPGNLIMMRLMMYIKKVLNPAEIFREMRNFIYVKFMRFGMPERIFYHQADKISKRKEVC